MAPGRFMVTMDRDSYWQCVFVVPKGGAASLQQRDISVFREQLRDSRPSWAHSSATSAHGTTSNC